MKKKDGLPNKTRRRKMTLSIFKGLTPAAKVTAVASGVFTVIWAIVTFAMSSDALFTILSFLVMAINAIIATYDVNCLFVGSCNVWGWVKTVFLVITSFTALFFLWVVASMRRQQLKARQAQQARAPSARA